MLKQFELEVLEVLLQDGAIPRTGLFQIEEFQLQEYLEAYHGLNGRSSKATNTNSNKRFCKTPCRFNFAKAVIQSRS